MRYGLFFGYLIATYFVGQQLAYLANWPVLYALVTLPGTIFHELMHYTVGALLDGSPSGFSIWPTWDANGNMESLGHVMVHPNWYNAAPVGLAPFLLVPLTGLLLARATTRLNPLKIALYLWGAACSWAACVPSGADFSIAGSYPSSWPCGVLMLAVVTWISYRVVLMTLRGVKS
jgi:hypothetical protein